MLLDITHSPSMKLNRYHQLQRPASLLFDLSYHVFSNLLLLPRACNKCFYAFFEQPYAKLFVPYLIDNSI